MRFYRYSWIVFCLAIYALIMAACESPQAEPTPASELIAGFVREVDEEFGYEILRPANWQAVDLGNQRGYAPPLPNGDPDQVLLVVANLQKVADDQGDDDTVVANYQIFQDNPTLTGWTQAIEAFWARMGIPFEPLQGPTDAMIYALTPLADQTQIVAFVVSAGQPLVITLNGYGAFANFEEIQISGLLTDFMSMVESAAAYEE